MQLNLSPKDSLYIRVLKFASKYPDGFNYPDIINSQELNLESWEKNIIGRHFDDALRRHTFNDNTKGETIFLFIHGEQSSFQSTQNKFILTLEAEFALIDYQELRDARINAWEAKRLSLWAIGISIFAMLISAVVPYWIAQHVTQDVRLDSVQFQEVKDFINTPPAI